MTLTPSIEMNKIAAISLEVVIASDLTLGFEGSMSVELGGSMPSWGS